MVDLLPNEYYRNKNINSNSNYLLKKTDNFKKLYNTQTRFDNKTRFNKVKSELAFITKRMVGNKPGETLDSKMKRALNYIARRKALREMKKQKDNKSSLYNLANYLNNTNNLDVFRKKSLAQMYGPAKKIQNAYRSYRYQKTGIQPSIFHKAARKIQGAWRSRNLRVPRNRINNVVQIPLNSKYVVQFKEGRAQRLVAPNTMKHMRAPNVKTFVSALSKEPIKNFRLRRVQYYNQEKNKNQEAKNKKNLENKIKNVSKKQNNLRRGKKLLNPISQMNQNALLARSLQENQSALRQREDPDAIIRRLEEEIQRITAESNRVRQNIARRAREERARQASSTRGRRPRRR